MVKDKEELLMESSKWGSLAIEEVKKLVEGLMVQKNMDVEELADFLGWKTKKVQACLDGEGDLRVKDLATLIIANDLVLEVKPSSETDIYYGSEKEQEEDDDEESPEWDDEEDEANENENNNDEANDRIRVVFGNVSDKTSLEDVLKALIKAFQRH